MSYSVKNKGDNVIVLKYKHCVAVSPNRKFTHLKNINLKGYDIHDPVKKRKESLDKILKKDSKKDVMQTLKNLSASTNKPSFSKKYLIDAEYVKNA